jgi:hypothetical protein
MRKWLFNPFTYIAGMRALLIGFAGMAIAAVIALFSKVHFDGAIDMHIGAPLLNSKAFIEPLVDWACLVLPLYILGRILSQSSIRFIDVAGTIALARLPLLLAALMGFLPIPPFNLKSADLHYIIAFTLNPAVILLIVLSIPLIIWTIALMYNAFSVSTNLKGEKSITAFVGGLVIAEVLSKVLLIYVF